MIEYDLSPADENERSIVKQSKKSPTLAIAAADPGMAFVLVQHLDPNHKSILSELIRRYTRLPVFEVEDGMVVQPNCVYF